MTKPYSIEPHGPAGNFALYEGRNPGLHGLRLLNLNDGDMHMPAHLKRIETALNAHDPMLLALKRVAAYLSVHDVEYREGNADAAQIRSAIQLGEEA